MIRICAAQPRERPFSRQERDWNLQQARWEAKLRLAAGKQAPDRPRAPPRARRPVALTLAEKFSVRDALLIARSGDSFAGSEEEDLACGGCGAVICSGISKRSLRRTHPEGEQLIVRCPCRALNVVA